MGSCITNNQYEAKCSTLERNALLTKIMRYVFQEVKAINMNICKVYFVKFIAANIKMSEYQI